MDIDLIPHTIRQGDWDKFILRRETQWIHHLDTVYPKVLNEQLIPALFNMYYYFDSLDEHRQHISLSGLTY